VRKTNTNSPHSSRKTMLFWCCKPLGLKSLHYLLARPDYNRTFVLNGIVVSSKDYCASDIRDNAKKKGIKIFEENEQITSRYDFGFCIGFPKKISKQTLDLCKDGVINLHFAPLPAYRGSGTLTHAIINEESEYGVTLHIMDEKLDTGPIITVKTIPLSEEKTALEIIKDIEVLGYEVVKNYFTDLINHTYELKDQDEIIKKSGIKPKFCTKKSVEALYKMDPSWDFNTVHKYLRALTLGKSKKPFFEKSDKKIYLSLTDD
jgi:methionyl-tRNA formyltransferase